MADTIDYTLQKGETADQYTARIAAARKTAGINMDTQQISPYGVDTYGHPYSAPTPGTQPQTPTTPTTPTAFGSSSFLPSTEEYDTIVKQAQDLYADPEYLKQQQAQHEAALSGIKGTFEAGMGDIQAEQETAKVQKQRGLELLQMSPAAIKSNVDSFIADSDSFDKQIADQIERLATEEANAVTTEDFNNAQALRQNKADLLNFQSQALQTKYNLIQNAYNMMLSGQQYQENIKNDALSQIDNAYKMGLPITTEQWQAAGFAGTPPSSDQRIAWQNPETLPNGTIIQRNQLTNEMRVLYRPPASQATALNETQKQAVIDSWAQVYKDNITKGSYVVPNPWQGITDPNIPDLKTKILQKVQSEVPAPGPVTGAQSSGPSAFSSWWDYMINAPVFPSLFGATPSSSPSGTLEQNAQAASNAYAAALQAAGAGAEGTYPSDYAPSQ